MFRPATGMPYRQFLNRLHQACIFDWYLEIGCRFGDSIAKVESKTMVVDPFFQIERNVIGAKPALMAFQQTSDDFFASGVARGLGARFGFAFLDGMHLFEYLLRDFMHTEALSLPDGAIAMHDCCPGDAGMTTRDLDNLPAGSWTGDVWKLIPILQEYRPDLVLDIYPSAPTGLVIARNLDPVSTVLADNYEAIIAKWRDIDIEGFGADRFFGSFEYLPERPTIRGGFAFLDAVKLSDDQRISPEKITP